MQPYSRTEDVAILLVVLFKNWCHNFLSLIMTGLLIGLQTAAVCACVKREDL